MAGLLGRNWTAPPAGRRAVGELDAVPSGTSSWSLAWRNEAADFLATRNHRLFGAPPPGAGSPPGESHAAGRFGRGCPGRAGGFAVPLTCAVESMGFGGIVARWGESGRRHQAGVAGLLANTTRSAEPVAKRSSACCSNPGPALARAVRRFPAAFASPDRSDAAQDRENTWQAGLVGLSVLERMPDAAVRPPAWRQEATSYLRCKACRRALVIRRGFS